jgi:hypothetical protein
MTKEQLIYAIKNNGKCTYKYTANCNRCFIYNKEQSCCGIISEQIDDTDSENKACYELCCKRYAELYGYEELMEHLL